MLVTSSRATPAAAQSSASVAAVVPELLVQPSTATSPSRTSIATTSCVGEPGGGLGEERGGEGGRPDHDAVGARRDRRGDRPVGAVAASDLERKPPGRGDAFDEPERRRAGECSVEVDEVQPPRAFVAEPPGELDRIASLDRDRLATALREADDASFEHVDRGRTSKSCVNTLSCYHDSNGTRRRHA